MHTHQAPLRSHARPDRRHSPRLRLAGELHGGLLPSAQPLAVLDVSSGGFAVESPSAFVPGRQYLFEFSSAGRTYRPLTAMSIHCLRMMENDETIYVSGFKFMASDAVDHETIDAMLGQVRALRAMAGSFAS